ncbi:ABC-2 type transport system ATP-binding protein [Geothermobacter ehrlichii]|uniref:ABC-2 type transport system ATP-binding protein n=1 Tax=Geothermobacter ehrlichii TaxID=213224 RepID=A0A5D3WP17_9BACT|nr:ABC transporter ATP-binding protein [Geothermobacter ehrlichii]TYO99946.1 ABC-2 type transport system ATP-binding protein [Geothermobacter ehrlichii]
MNAIDIERLCKTYRGKRGARVVALTDLTLHVAAGEVFGFLGPNGAGKSTTIKILTGQIRPGAGDAKIFGVPAVSPEARGRVGYLPENPSFFHFMTALEYLDLVGRVYGMNKQDIRRESERVLSLLELEQAARRPIRGYSKGMVQRLGLAQALLHDPDLYILDEPMSGLDPVGRALVKKIIRELKKKGKTVFFSTHITADVEEVCDRLAVLAGGRLRALESVDSLLHERIEGYRIHGSSPGDEHSQRLVSPSELKTTLETLLQADFQVERIEPVRQNLEDFFLETIRGDSDANK